MSNPLNGKTYLRNEHVSGNGALSSGKRPDALAASETITQYQRLTIQTLEAPEFIDLTDTIQNLVQRSQIEFGTVNVQTRHTTTGLLVNENEKLLLEDFARQLEVNASTQAAYRHDELHLRKDISPQERQNGHAHCKAMQLRTSETINIAYGNLDLGTWQRIFLVEFDTASTRTVSLLLAGTRSRPNA